MAYSPELAALICERMAEGKSLREVCRAEDIPVTEAAVRKWAIEDHDGFSAHYARARESQIEAMAEDLVEIADDKTGDPQRDRLRVDSRKWLMSKVAPKKYGDKLEHEHKGSIVVERVNF